MNINEQKQDQRIRSIYKNTQAPDIVKNRTEETLSFLKQQEKPSSAVQNEMNRQRKPLSFKRAAILAAAAILCISGTVFAAERIYQMQLKKEKEYQANLQISSEISSERELPEEVEEIKMEVNYVPEGFTYDPGKEYYVNPGRDAGYSIGEPVLIDKTEPLKIPFVKNSEQLTINGHEAVYICNTYTEDTLWRNEHLYILLKDIDRIFSVNSWGHADKNELIKIAENVSFTSTGKMISAKELHLWSEIMDSWKIWDEDSDEYAENDDYYFNEASEAQMANVHQIGEKFKIQSFPDDENMTDVQLEVSVRDIQTADDLSLLTKKEAIPDYMKELTGADGKLIRDTLNYIKGGDGINTMPKLVRTEETNLKLVYAAVEFSNPGAETVQDVWYLVSLMPVVKDGDTYKIFSRTDDTCDYVENEHTGVKYEMSYMDVSGGRNDNNYIPEIKPGESVTVHLAWIVNEDELDKLYLDFTGDGIFTEEGLKTGYVSLGDRRN